MQDAKKLRAVVKAYKECKPPPGKKRKEFVILQYIEERRRESAVLCDGVCEMMTLRAYVSWMGKAKNGSLDAATASELWKQKFEAPGAITDKKGDHPRYRDRVAISTKDLSRSGTRTSKPNPTSSRTRSRRKWSSRTSTKQSFG